jgi:hypothetical protein
VSLSVQAGASLGTFAEETVEPVASRVLARSPFEYGHDADTPAFEAATLVVTVLQPELARAVPTPSCGLGRTHAETGIHNQTDRSHLEGHHQSSRRSTRNSCFVVPAAKLTLLLSRARLRERGSREPDGRSSQQLGEEVQAPVVAGREVSPATHNTNLAVLIEGDPVPLPR